MTFVAVEIFSAYEKHFFKSDVSEQVFKETHRMLLIGDIRQAILNADEAALKNFDVLQCHETNGRNVFTLPATSCQIAMVLTAILNRL